MYTSQQCHWTLWRIDIPFLSSRFYQTHKAVVSGGVLCRVYEISDRRLTQPGGINLNPLTRIHTATRRHGEWDFDALHTVQADYRCNKNAFQWDAYCPVQWPSDGGGGLSSDGCLPRGDVCPGRVSGFWVSAQGVYTPRTQRQTPPPVNRITDRCQSITFPQLLWRTVKIPIRYMVQVREENSKALHLLPSSSVWVSPPPHIRRILIIFTEQSTRHWFFSVLGAFVVNAVLTKMQDIHQRNFRFRFLLVWTDPHRAASWLLSIYTKVGA